MSVPESKKEAVARLEWEMFTNVRNQGGRADCQDDPGTFFLMRMSQYAAWPEALLDSYRADLEAAAAAGRNLAAEKYAWMMEATAPEEFRRIRHLLPDLSWEKEAMIEEIAAAETAWFREYAEKYPALAAGNRKAEDNAGSLGGTSMSVYLRGELRTYSERTTALYLDMIRALQDGGGNMAVLVMDDQMKRRGFAGIDDAERRLTERQKRADSAPKDNTAPTDYDNKA